jgi:dethiobiotin synthetase
VITNSIFISATDTGVGKTFHSVKLLKKLLDLGYKREELAYYKPIQCGDNKDYSVITQDLGDISTYCSYDLHYPASPHYAAQKEGIVINLEKIRSDYDEIKTKHKFIVVEGAGGLAVPLNYSGDLVSDIPRVLELPIILVIRPNLGTINHSLLSIEHARTKGLEICGIIVSELALEADTERTKNSIDTIIKFGGVKIFSYGQFGN